MIRKLNVYEATQRRLKALFDYADFVYVSFSGGKDSSILLNMCIDYIRRHEPGRKLGVFHMDYEVQYAETTRFVEHMLQSNSDILEVYHCCVPFKVETCTSMFQNYWRPWDEKCRELWVRELPERCYTAADFDFFNEDMWDYDFQYQFVNWLRRRKNYKRICCVVGIRTEESIHRWRAIHHMQNKRILGHYKWTYQIGYKSYNTYPIYDWKTADVWAANFKAGWEYNHLYDLFYQAGIPFSRQRVASPFISPALPTLAVYKAIDPDMWGRMIGRVNGVAFAGLYGGTTAMAWKTVACPPGFTWEKYMYFLLDTLPKNVRDNYLRKLQTSIQFWRNKGGCLSDSTIHKLRQRGVKLTVEGKSAYKTDKRPVRMEYLDDIDISEFREIPSYKRMCICILKNDHTCKYMGFTPTKRDKEQREKIMAKYKNLKSNGRI